MQTGPGQFDGLLQMFALDTDVCLYRERVNVPLLQQGSMKKGWRTFGIPLRAYSTGTLQGRAVGATIGHLSATRDFVAQSAGPSDHAGIVVGDNTFVDYADYLGGIDSLSWQDHSLLETSQHARELAAAGIRQALTAASDNLAALEQPAAGISLRDDILEILFCLLIDAHPPRRRNEVTRLTYSEIVNRCREHLLAVPNEPIGVLQLSRLLRVSRRTLQTSFLEVAGVTPHAYLRAIRLSSVRRLLRQTSGDRLSIQAAAARWGFVNMGKFAAQYREMFGYLPSETSRA
ncbi:helix-turn-helix domain-containing protein [Cupriavidus sp. IDO]|uniref:helix-turn-helix domain-containing protein n=1 Tax=Cupriavidus sp. IDO TaxID=1539142 RepID=UPI00187C868C|nr:helix-turn-helix domain-containing protein [Cupriavidus sp. IDO]